MSEEEEEEEEEVKNKLISELIHYLTKEGFDPCGRNYRDYIHLYMIEYYINKAFEFGATTEEIVNIFI